VFVVGHLGNWKPTAEVLFESDCLRRDTKKGREKREETADSPLPSIVGTLDTECGGGRKAHQSVMSGHFIPTFWNGTQKADTLTCTSDNQRMPDKNRFQAILQPISFPSAMSGTQAAYSSNLSLTLQAKNRTAVACIGGQHPNAAIGENIAPTLTNAMGAGGGHIPIIGNLVVRRLTEVECERLQGFPDNYTNIKENCPSGARYKALGNSMAVPVMRWIGERINSHETMCSTATL
jgi:DNA (cytosine-5)-methyltransferase 1